MGWGYSLGSGAISDLASKSRVDVVIDRGFSSMSEVAYQKAPSGLKTIARIIFFVGAHFNNLSKLKKARGNIFIAQGLQDTIMTEDQHGKFLKDAISQHPHAIFKKVNSSHLHCDTVWFESGNERTDIEKFLNN